jgi:hypothetical protein
MKILQSEITGTQTGFSTNFDGKLSFILSCLSFSLSASTDATYIFTALTCTINIISLEPCALNAEFHRFILRFNKNFIILWIPVKEGILGESRLPRQGEDKVTLKRSLISQR